jgi:DNA modification methylase
MLTAVYPKLEADAHLMIFCSWRTEDRVRAVVQSTGYSVRGSYIWDKQAATAGDLNGTLGSSHERIVHAVKGKPLVYERDRDVLSYARVPTDRHPTEKPAPLLKRLIETMAARMDLVVDPFGGVASTMVAATECGRGYWGCELDKRYHAIGCQRLAATREGD